MHEKRDMSFFLCVWLFVAHVLLNQQLSTPFRWKMPDKAAKLCNSAPKNARYSDAYAGHTCIDFLSNIFVLNPVSSIPPWPFKGIRIYFKKTLSHCCSQLLPSPWVNPALARMKEHETCSFVMVSKPSSQLLDPNIVEFSTGCGGAREVKT